MSSTRPFGSRPLPPPVAIPEFDDPDAPPPPLPPSADGTMPEASSALLPPMPKPPPPLFGAPSAPTSPNAAPSGTVFPNSGDESDTELQEELTEALSEVATRTTRMRLALTGLFFVVAGLAIAAIWWASSQPETATPEEVDTSIGEALDATTVPQPIGPLIYNTLIPSMVLIQVGEGDLGSIGTGVVINDQADIMTAFHVVDGDGEIQVSFTDGSVTTATILEADPANDIAVLSVSQQPQVVVPAVLGGGVAIGEPVYALGNPLGLTGSFSEGVVSGLERTLPIDDDLSLEGLIQFDAAVNPGSSGGPLINRNGQVVGIVTALASPTGEDFFSGIGFAVPIATAGGAAGGPQQ